MYRYMMKKRGLFCLTVVLLAVSGVTGTLFSIVMSRLVDCAGKSVEELLGTLLVSVGYVVVYILLNIAFNCSKAAVLTNARYYLKKDVFAGIMNQEAGKFDIKNSAEYINELGNNINMLESLYFNNILGALQCLVSFTAAAAICIAVQPLMLVLMMVLAFITMWITKMTAEPLKRSTENFADSTGKYVAEIQDDFGGFHLIRTSGILPYIIQKHDGVNREAETAKRRNSNCRILCSCTGQFVGVLSTVLVMALAAGFALRGMISVGMVIAFGHLIGQIVSPITQIPSVIANFNASKPLMERFRALMSIEAEEGTESIPSLLDGIEMEDLSFRYQNEREILHRLSYRFPANGRYAITGSSGSGKSTLLALLQGYDSNYEGNICFDGIELRKLTRQCLGELMGVVSQDTFLFNDTLINNITLYREGYTPEQIEDAVERAGLRALVETLPDGMQTVVSENGKNFSGGEKQRISLARVLLRKNRILLLDEFTAHLDQQTACEIEKRVLGCGDCTLMAVTHRLSSETFKQYEQVLVLSHG